MANAIDNNGVGAGATATLFGPTGATGGGYIYALITSTQTFRANIEISSDAGATWTIAKVIASATGTGSDGTYLNAAEISQYAPNLFRIRATNTSASSANFRSDIRLFQVAAN